MTAINPLAPTPAEIEGQIEALINSIVGDKLTASEKSRLHMLGTMIGTVAGEVLPLVGHKETVDTFMTGLGNSLGGLLHVEEGIKAMISATSGNSGPLPQAA